MNTEEKLQFALTALAKMSVGHGPCRQCGEPHRYRPVSDGLRVEQVEHTWASEKDGHSYKSGFQPLQDFAAWVFGVLTWIDAGPTHCSQCDHDHRCLETLTNRKTEWLCEWCYSDEGCPGNEKLTPEPKEPEPTFEWRWVGVSGTFSQSSEWMEEFNDRPSVKIQQALIEFPGSVFCGKVNRKGFRIDYRMKLHRAVRLGSDVHVLAARHVKIVPAIPEEAIRVLVADDLGAVHQVHDVVVGKLIDRTPQ